MPTPERRLRTERLLLRGWRESDLEPFARLNADPQVMRYFPAPLSREESDTLAERIATSLTERSWGLWAVERDGVFLGFTGLAVPRFEAPFTPAVEIGWRLARAAWGFGYATEAATAVLRFASEELRLDSVVSFTAVENRRSRAVMERIGMVHDEAGDFDHPAIPAPSPLRRHVLYRANLLEKPMKIGST
jgi:RimJ/RimL family protein N-acetyltransferase